MGLPSPARIAQYTVGALAVATIVITFSSPRQEGGALLIPAERRAPMPDFTMMDLQGLPWALAPHRGRVVLVNFWATWCPPCREEIPAFVRLAQTARGLDIAGIAMDDGGAAQVREFVKSAGIPYPILLPTASSPLVNAIQSLPTTFLVDKEGRIAQRYFGAVNESTVRLDVSRLEAER